MIKIVIFDLDGTLINTLEDLTDSTNFALNYFSYPPKTTAQIKSYIGNGVSKLIERAIPDGKDNKNFEKCLELFKKNYSQNMYNKTHPYQGILNMLKDLKSDGYKIAVVSNKFDIAVKELCNKYFPDLIDFSSGEDEKNGIKKKPAPDTVLKVLNKFNYKNSEAIYVGDSEVDIQTARNCNIKSISVSWGYKTTDFLIQNNAQTIINTPNELIEILKVL